MGRRRTGQREAEKDIMVTRRLGMGTRRRTGRREEKSAIGTERRRKETRRVGKAASHRARATKRRGNQDNGRVANKPVACGSTLGFGTFTMIMFVRAAQL